MLIRLKIADQANALKKLDCLAPRTMFGIEKGLYFIGRDLMAEVDKQVLSTPKTGRIYIRRDRLGRRRRHQSSAPGESHANMTGTLRKSKGYKVSGNFMVFGYGATTKQAPIYARKIESTRPTLQNAINAQIKNAEQHLGDNITKELD